ncbi:MAG: hypothetical protein ACTSRZ_10815 [Promethearchaeota archaeon]
MFQQSSNNLNLPDDIPNEIYQNIFKAFYSIMIKGIKNLENQRWTSEKLIALMTDGLKLLFKKIHQFYLDNSIGRCDNQVNNKINNKNPNDIDDLIKTKWNLMEEEMLKMNKTILQLAILKYKSIYGEEAL